VKLQEGKVPDSDLHFMSLFVPFFDTELSRILIFTAIQCRILANMEYYCSNPCWEKPCGELEITPKMDKRIGVGPLWRGD
jgi:hypothetical protein